MKLALGTVQFGLDYGVANSNGQVSLNEVDRILDFASSISLDTIDTAIAYGDSERVLGGHDLSAFKVITKLPEMPVDVDAIENWIKNELQLSLSRLKLKSVDGLLLHRSHQLLGEFGDAVYKSLLDLKDSGFLKKIGVSVYSPDEIKAVVDCRDIDLIQAPMNIFDKRLEQSGLLSELKRKGVEIHARSVFLQGLLLMNKKNLPEKFNLWGSHFSVWYEWLAENPDISAAQLCLNYINQIPEVDKMVIGVDSLFQLKEAVTSLNRAPNKYPEIFCNDERLLNPSNWAAL